MFAALHEYFLRHWNELGGEHFVALCTAINIAIISWPEFQKRIRYAETRLKGKWNSVELSFSDLNNAHYKKLVAKCMGPVAFISRWGWRFIYALALLGAITGTAMLYFHKSCPYDFLLLLPTLTQLILSWTTLGIVTGWMSLMSIGMGIFFPKLPSSASAARHVAALKQEIKDQQLIPLSDAPCIVWEKDMQLIGWKWRIRNTGGPVTILETRCSAGTLHVRRFLDTGVSCAVLIAGSGDSEQDPSSAPAEDYYGLKYRSKLGIVSQKVYRYHRESTTLAEAPEIPFDRLGNAVQPVEPV